MAKTCKSTAEIKQIAREFEEAERDYQEGTGDDPVWAMIELGSALASEILNDRACALPAPKKTAGLSGRRRR